MYTEITFQESNASRRLIYFSLYSRTQYGTPQTLGSASTCEIVRGGAAPVATTNNLVISDKTNGIYSLQLTQSECSVMGSYGEMAILAGSYASAAPTLRYIKITAVDSGDSMRYGLFALPNFAASAASGLLVLGTGTGGINASSGSVDAQYLDLSSKLTVGVGSIKAATYSGVTVGSAATILAGTYSGVTLGVNNIAAGTYSGVTVGINNIAAGNYSGVTTSGVTSTNVTGLAAGVITTTSIAAAALDSTVFSTGAEQAFADRLLLRNIAGGADSGRTVGTALYAIRNKVDMSGSVGTVYRTDDVTSAFTVTVTAGFNPAATIDPKGL